MSKNSIFRRRRPGALFLRENGEGFEILERGGDGDEGFEFLRAAVHFSAKGSRFGDKNEEGFEFFERGGSGDEGFEFSCAAFNLFREGFEFGFEK